MVRPSRLRKWTRLAAQQHPEAGTSRHERTCWCLAGLILEQDSTFACLGRTARRSHRTRGIGCPVRSCARVAPGGRDDSNSTNSLVYDSATVAVVVFIVVLALVPLYSSIGRDEVLPPPLGPVSTFSTLRLRLCMQGPPTKQQGPPTKQQVQWLKARVDRNTREYHERRRDVFFPAGPQQPHVAVKNKLPTRPPDTKRIDDVLDHQRPVYYHRSVPDYKTAPPCEASMDSSLLVKLRYLYTRSALLRDQHRRVAMSTSKPGGRVEYNKHQIPLTVTLEKGKRCHEILSARRSTQAAEVSHIYNMLVAQARAPFAQRAPLRPASVNVAFENGW